MMKHRTSTSRLSHHLSKQTVLVVTDHINYTILLVRDQHYAEQALNIKIHSYLFMKGLAQINISGIVKSSSGLQSKPIYRRSK